MSLSVFSLYCLILSLSSSSSLSFQPISLSSLSLDGDDYVLTNANGTIKVNATGVQKSKESKGKANSVCNHNGRI
jgi:hypothetical protein